MTALILIALATLGQTPNSAPPALNACTSITDAAARLSCYDTAMSRIAQQAEQDQETQAEAARSRFGKASARRSEPRIKAAKAPRVDQIDAIIRSVSVSANGHYGVRLDDGSVWLFTTEVTPMPKVGDAIQIRRAALGSYMGSVAKGREGRIQRQR